MTTLLRAVLLAAVLSLSACPEADTPTTTPTDEPIACSATSDCLATGQLCAGGFCSDCNVDPQCIADYGDGATCQAGVCLAGAADADATDASDTTDVAADTDAAEVSCEPGSDGCTCYSNNSCDSPLSCVDSVCVDCSAGAVGCPCSEATDCGDGATCDGSACVACTDGALGCACGAGDTCDSGFCVDGVCSLTCETGDAGCECYSNNSCNGTLDCLSGLCVDCATGALGCACDDSNPCAAGTSCNAGVCVGCTDGIFGCPCDGGSCDDGLRCNDQDTCEVCPQGDADCPCNDDGSCGDGLRCNADTLCEICPEGELDCPCAAGACDDGLRCNAANSCEICPLGELGCGCDLGVCAGGTDPTVTCDDATDTCVTCDAGTEGCPCDAGTCPGLGLECIADSCVACNRGELGCTCFDNGYCDSGVICGSDNLCAACAPGSPLCECADPDLCGENASTCVSFTADEAVGSVCTAADCTDGDVGCACLPYVPGPGEPPVGAADAPEGLCTDAANACLEGLCKPCSSDIEGCPCDAGDTCSGGLVCDTDEASCRQPLECFEVCADHQLCEAAADADPTCQEACEAGWDYNAATQSCDATVELTCTPDVEGSIAALCAGKNRGCDAGTNDASCGACLDTFVDEGGTLDICRPVVTCGDLPCAGLNLACTAETTTTDAACGTCLPGTIVSPGGPVGGYQPCQPVATCSDVPCALAGFVCIEGDDGIVSGTPVDATCTDDCQPFYVKAGDGGFGSATCTPVETCDSLGCAGLFRECTPETETADAVCGDCLFDYQIDPDGSGTCVPVPANCVPDAPGSLVDDCLLTNQVCDATDPDNPVCGACINGYAQNPDNNNACEEITSCVALGCNTLLRECVGQAPFETCGDCFEGFVDDPSGAQLCIPPLSCADGICAAGEFCIEGTATTSASCIAAQCDIDNGFVYSDFSQGCITCDKNCGDDEGETGRPWPNTAANSDTCVCETEPGFYWDSGKNRAAPCDGDGDGWVRNSARLYVESSDESWSANARCDVRTIDRFVLQNELGQRLPILICQGAEDYVRADLGSCTVPATLSLYEAEVLDDQTDLEAAQSGVPDYAAEGIGRQFVASEVNGLTRACAQGADFNGNGRSDISEWHGMEVGTLSADQYILSTFSFYMELHDSYYEPGTEKAYIGQYVIAEKSRCDLSFPMTYDTASDYWRQCTRSRDAAYDRTDDPASNPDIGLDFARWSCDSTTGSCPVPPPLTDALPVANAIPAHGACDAQLPHFDDECLSGDTSPWECVGGSIWRGMNHHSQFRCVVVDNTPSLTTPHAPVADFAPGTGAYTLNVCKVACPDGDDSCSADCTDGACTASSTAPTSAGNPNSPVITCTTESAPTAGDVGFALTNYVGDGTYQRGCISEWEPNTIAFPGEAANGTETVQVSPWRSLCPGFLDNPDSILGEALDAEFGKLVCGCARNYGGPGCSLGCSDDNVLVQSDYETKPRTGFWMCADTAASACQLTTCNGSSCSYETCDTSDIIATDPEGGVWTLDAEVNRYGIGGASVLTETGVVQTCAALGITNGGTYGDPDICGASICTEEVTFAEAEATCAGAGMRLCTLEELGNDEPRGTGCGYDASRTWSSTTCAGGYETTSGATPNLGSIPTQCTDASQALAVTRCCADSTVDAEPSGWQLH